MIERPTNVTKAIVTSEKRLQSEEPEKLKEALEYFWSQKKELYHLAYAMQRKVIEERLSYRDFGVGAAAVVYRSSDNSFAIMPGWNEKKTKSSVKHCAEMKIFEKAQNQGYDKVIGIVVVGERQEDASKVACTTLHPCRECRNVMRRSRLAWSDMPVVTMSIPPDVDFADLGDYSPVEEQNTLAQLLFEHDNALNGQGIDPEEDRF